MSILSKTLKKAERWIGSKIPHITSEEKRTALTAAKEQIDYYQQAKQDLVNTRSEAEAEKKSVRARIDEKAIRAKQRQYRRGGFMAEPSTGINNTLG